jgi:3',5'-cyclic-AMP phosphodiesterase
VRLVWTTDLHLDSVSTLAWEQWVQKISSLKADGLVITGDISEGDDVVRQLQRFVSVNQLPVYFVLGNHDFYGSTFQATRQNVIHACRDSEQLHYLTDLSPLQVSAGTYLLGEDGWADGTVGNYEESTIHLKDFERIGDFKAAGEFAWKQQLQEIGGASAKRLRSKLEQLPSNAHQIIVLTHAPPFREACWYEGKTTDDNWAPFFVAGQVGNTLMEFSRLRPECNVTVLCGHTHHAGIARMAANLQVYTGAASYGHPDIEATISVAIDELDITRVSNLC